MEYSKQSEYSASLPAGNPNKTTSATNAEFLKGLLRTTGCREQICANINSQIPLARENSDAADSLVIMANRIQYTILYHID